MLYMALNMVRAGVVKHPSQWAFSEYNEILAPYKRYALIDYRGVRQLLNFKGMNELADAYRGWVEESLHVDDHHRDEKWTESVAVGTERFVTAIKERLGIKVKGREVIGENGSYELREPRVPYGGTFTPQNDLLRLQNTYFWDDIV
jgi:hypothetical protein